jgi:hypothetical protein
MLVPTAPLYPALAEERNLLALVPVVVEQRGSSE